MIENYMIMIGFLFVITWMVMFYYYKYPPNNEVKYKKKVIINRDSEEIPDQIDPVAKVDYLKIYDPMTEPDRRPERHNIPPDYVAMHMNISTRGFPESYHMVGTLQRTGSTTDLSLKEKLLTLYGRETYPHSKLFEYYAIIPELGTKLQIENRTNNELFDDDTVYISELNGHYKVKMYKQEDPAYNPFIQPFM